MKKARLNLKTYTLELPRDTTVEFPVVVVGSTELAFKFKPQAAGRALYCTMGASLMQRRRVRDDGLRVLEMSHE